MIKTNTGHKEELTKKETTLILLKKVIWLYFFLLIFEGALRKWFLPFLSAPLLIVRDPVAIVLIFLAWKHNIVKANLYVLVLTFFTLFSVCTALVVGHGSVTVAIYGARILIIHFPVMFIIGKIFDLKDVTQIGRVLLVISIPMTILIALQYYSPQSAFVNRTVGGAEGSGFGGVGEYFRPSGTFSFTTGNVLFFSMVACYIFYFWIAEIKIKKIILIASTFALVIATPLSISRTLLLSIVITLLFTVISVVNKPKYFYKVIGFIVLGSVILGILSQTPFFEGATEVITQRFENASNSEGSLSNSIGDRIFGGMLTAITESHDLPFFGFGIGMGTNAGSALLTGERTFLIAEGEWLRLVGEMGFVIGIFALLIRLVFTIQLFLQSYSVIKYNNILPWLLLSFGALIILQGQWAQPTVLGFSTLIGGLILAASKKKLNNKTPKIV